MRIIAGPYPAFRLAESQPEAKGSALLTASGFEGGELGPGFETEGDSVELSHGKLVLGPDARLLVGAEGQPVQGSSLSYRLLEGRAAAALRLESGALLVVDSDGSVRLDDQDTNLRVGASGATGDIISVSVEPTKEGLRVYGLGDTPIIVKDSALAEDARWALYPAGENPLAIADVSLSIFSAPIAVIRGDSRSAEDSAAAGPRGTQPAASPDPVQPISRNAQGGGIAALGL
jgi:hypothetical protein